MTRLFLLSSFVGMALLVAGCGGGGGDQPDANVITFFDAAPPDAPPPPDAFVCVETDTIKACGSGIAGCVDITNDPLNCGMCGYECPAGAACQDGPSADLDAGTSDLAHCECPPDFVPANITGFLPPQLGIEPIQAIDAVVGDYAGFGLFGSSTINAVLVTFNDGTGTGTATPIASDIDLAGVTGATPRFGFGYNIDIASQTFQAAFMASAGTLNLEYACQTGAAGTVTNATFIAVQDLTNPIPVEGGCSFTVESVHFTVGSPCG